MRITSGKVISGKVVVDDDVLPEGATVTVVAPEESEEFELGPADEAALHEAIQQADDGNTVPANEVLSRLERGS
ncbi:MAG: hypothetical protein E4H03_09010 [Myxococcales bacterium]|nr:MAG: hypothetical protein E4H03_09010 [Myxococcales bacterium]